jgi:hypothetical protein
MAYIIAPTFRIKTITWTLDRPGQVNTSAWTGKRTTVTDPWHGKWSAHVELATLQGETGAAAYMAFLAKVRGALSTFQLPATAGAQNTNSGVTVATSAAQGATAVDLTGYGTSLTAGQKVTINDQLLQLTADQEASGYIYFEPPLREAANVGTPVETANPYALVYMADTKQGYSIETWRRYGISFDAIEAVGEPSVSSYALSLEFKPQRYFASGKRQSLLSGISGYAFSGTGAQGSSAADGSVTFFGTNVPAITTLGYDCYESATNILLQSQTFSNASWAKSGSSITSSGQADPTGNFTGCILTEDTSNGAHLVSQGVNLSASTTYAMSCFVKRGTGTRNLNMTAKDGGGSNGVRATFDLGAGTVSVAAATFGTGWSVTGAFIASASKNYYRVVLVFTAPSAGVSGGNAQFLMTNGTATSYLGDGASNLVIWQAQIINGSYSNGGPMIATTTASVNCGPDDLEIGASLSGDFIAWAVVNLAQLPSANVTPFAYSTAGAGSANTVVFGQIQSGGNWAAGVTDGGVSQPVPSALSAVVAAGRNVLMVRRKNGIYSTAVKNPSGTITISADASGTGTVPAGIAAVEIGCSYSAVQQIDARVEGFFQRNGTFTDADVTAILTAA